MTSPALGIYSPMLWYCVGLIDSSGLKFHYTKTLRPHDAGIMELGLEYTDKMALPPGVAVWKLVGYCIPQCTRVVSDASRGLLYALRFIRSSVCAIRITCISTTLTLTDNEVTLSVAFVRLYSVVCNSRDSRITQQVVIGFRENFLGG